MIDRHTLAHAGYQEYTRRLARHWGDPLPDSVVLVAATAHYSWEKIVRALGIGAEQLAFVPVDRHCRIDPDALWERIEQLHARRAPILACISVCGTTEEGAMDRLDRVLEVRARAEQELGVTFHLHADACYGGYAAAVTRRADGSHRTGAEIRASTGINWPSDDWVQSMVALGWFDSVTIDPHKLGFVPYPAGAMLLRDRRARDLVAVEPPYLAPAARRSAGRVVPGTVHPRGIQAWCRGRRGVARRRRCCRSTSAGTATSSSAPSSGRTGCTTRSTTADLSPFRAVMLPRPDLNIVCFVVTHPSLTRLAAVNRLNEGVYRQMSLGGSDQMPDYMITRTRLTHPNYDGAVPPLLPALGLSDAGEWEGLPRGAGGAAVNRHGSVPHRRCGRNGSRGGICCGTAARLRRSDGRDHARRLTPRQACCSSARSFDSDATFVVTSGGASANPWNFSLWVPRPWVIECSAVE